MTAKRDLRNQRFGRGIVISDSGRTPNQNMIWKLRCDCGVEYEARSSDLIQGRILSCGCLKHEICIDNESAVTHGFARHKSPRHPAYKTWCWMRKACRNPGNRDYGLYGGKGISCCWNTFEEFWADIGKEYPGPGHRLKRLNTDDDFTLENCYWQPIGLGRRRRRYPARIHIDGRTVARINMAEHAAAAPVMTREWARQIIKQWRQIGQPRPSPSPPRRTLGELWA
jgi:hypothetical protein